MRIRKITTMAIRNTKALCTKKTLQHAIVLLSCLGFVMILLQEHVGFLRNTSDSSAYKLFIHFKTLKPRKGDYTVVSSTFTESSILKKIVGGEGDRLRVRKDKIFLNDTFIGIVYPYATDGRVLIPTPEQVIPKDHGFLYSPHHGSFDSRYQQLGLVPLKQCFGRAYPLF